MRHLLFALALAGPSLALRAAGAQRAPERADPRADTVAVSLNDAITRALRVGEEAIAATAQLDLTEAQVTVARSTALPQLRLNGTYNKAIENARAQAVGSVFNQPNTYNVNANLSQSVFQGGRIVAGLRAARRNRSASELTLAETRAQLALDVQRAYLDVLLSGQITAIQRANLQVANARVTQVEQFARGGRAARYDVLRARVERSNLEPLVLEAENTRNLALLELKRLANIPAERPIRLTTVVDTAGIQQVLAALDSADARGEEGPSVGERASVQAAELTARARRDAITVARADLFPTVSVFLQSGYQAFPVSGSPLRRGATTVVPCTADPVTGVPDPSCRPSTSQNGGFFSDRTFGVQVGWPLFDGLRVKGNIDLAQAQSRVAEAQLAQERERVAVEIAQARAELGRARATYTARQQNVNEAGEAFRLASLRFTRGVGTQLDVSDAQLALLTAQTDQARAVYDLYFATLSLAFAQGRSVPLPVGGGGQSLPATPGSALPGAAGSTSPSGPTTTVPAGSTPASTTPASPSPAGATTPGTATPASPASPPAAASSASAP